MKYAVQIKSSKGMYQFRTISAARLFAESISQKGFICCVLKLNENRIWMAA